MHVAVHASLSCVLLSVVLDFIVLNLCHSVSVCLSILVFLTSSSPLLLSIVLCVFLCITFFSYSLLCLLLSLYTLFASLFSIFISYSASFVYLSLSLKYSNHLSPCPSASLTHTHTHYSMPLS